MPPVSVQASVRAYGVRFQVFADDQALLARVLTRLPPGARVVADRRTPAFACGVVRTERPAAWRVVLDSRVEAIVAGEAEALEVVEGTLRFEVARRSPRWTFVHAGVVGWQGRAIVIPGESFSGKSTLVDALVAAGATYYSDEYAVLDRRGRVYPFPQPLTRRLASGARERVAVAALAGVVGTEVLPVGAVVSTRYNPGASWNPVHLSPAQGVLALLANTIQAQANPARVMRVLARVAETARMMDGVRGEADETARALLNEAALWRQDDRPRRNIA